MVGMGTHEWQVNLHLYVLILGILVAALAVVFVIIIHNDNYSTNSSSSKYHYMDKYIIMSSISRRNRYKCALDSVLKEQRTMDYMKQ